MSLPTCIDCGNPAKKGRPAVIHENWAHIDYVCQKCWVDWAPFMHARACKCGHCKWCAEQLQQRWSYGSGSGTLAGDMDL